MAITLDQHLYNWIKVANERRDRFGFPPGLIEDRIFEMKRALGESYLERVFGGNGVPHILGLRGHELELWLRGGSRVDEHVIRVVEFASYLETFKEDECLEGKLVKIRRESSLAPTFFELAMAFRMKQVLGTVGSVSLSCEKLEPIGDFTAKLNNKKIICECSRLDFGEGAEEQYRLAGDIYKYIEKRAKRLSVPICLKIRMSVPLTGGAFFNKTVQTLRLLFEHIERNSTPRTMDAAGLSASIELLTSTSERLPFRCKENGVVDVLNTDWVSAYSLCYLPPDGDTEFHKKYGRGEDLHEQEYGRIFLKFPRNISGSDPYSRIKNKIQKKRSQTDVPIGYWGRIIFLESPWDIMNMDALRVEAVMSEGLRGSKNTLAVILCQRCSSTHYRSWYLHFRPALGDPFVRNTEIQDCLTQLVTYDRDFDPILNERFSRTWAQASSLAAEHEREWQELQEKGKEIYNIFQYPRGRSKGAWHLCKKQMGTL